MKTPIQSFSAALPALAAMLCGAPAAGAQNGASPAPVPATDDLALRDASVNYREATGTLSFEQRVAGTAGATKPETPGFVRELPSLHWEDVSARGRFDKAAVLAYVFPTTLGPEDVGFGKTDGILALAATSHPVFDDTPLWDENADGRYDNDAAVYHAHWVVLIRDERADGGFAVKPLGGKKPGNALPPTAPGMPIYLDSPGFQVMAEGKRIRIIVPESRVRGNTDFQFDALTAYLETNTSDPSRPVLGVYKIYDVLGGGLDLDRNIAKQAHDDGG